MGANFCGHGPPFHVIPGLVPGTIRGTVLVLVPGTVAGDDEEDGPSAEKLAPMGLSCPYSTPQAANSRPVLLVRLFITDSGMQGGGRALLRRWIML